MKMEKTTILVFVAVTFIFGLLTNANAGIIVNGSFENGLVDPGSWHTLAADSCDIDGWVVSPDAIDYIGDYWAASDGDKSLDLDNADGCFGGIKQTFATDVGGVYLVTFDMAGNPGRGFGDPAIKYMRVSAAGDFADFSFDSTGHSRDDMGWETHSWQFTADDTSTTLEFYSLHGEIGGYSGYCGPALDNVSVSVIHSPEPTTISLLGLGSLVWLRRRRT